MGKGFGGAVELPQVATPSSPPAGRQLLYPKGDGKWYTRDSSGTESMIGAGAVPGAHTHAAADVSTGTFLPARLGSGASATSFLRGDSTFQTLTLADLPDAWVKRAVRAASTANVALPPGGTALTIDGVALANGDRVLLKDQTAPAQNGIYVVGGIGSSVTLTRPGDADLSADMAGATVSVDQGTQGGFVFTTYFKTTDTLGSTAMAFYRDTDAAQMAPNGGTAAGTWVQGSDSRLSDRRSPMLNSWDNQDLNTLTETGFYQGSTWTNGPSGVTSGMLTVTGTGLYTSQILAVNDGSFVWTRSRANGVWSAWKAQSTVGHTHPASDLTATGTRDATTFLRGDNTWAVPAGGGGSANPTGTILMYGAATPPSGYLACNGQAVSRTTYAALFGVLQTAYGTGDGTTTFNLPDFRLLHPVGYDDSGTPQSGLGAPGRYVAAATTMAQRLALLQNAHSHSTSETGVAPAITASSGAGSSHSHLVNSAVSSESSHTHTGTASSTSLGQVSNTTVTGTNSRLTGPDSHAHTITVGAGSSHNHSVTVASGSESSHTHTISASQSSHSHSVSVASNSVTAPIVAVNFIIKT